MTLGAGESKKNTKINKTLNTIMSIGNTMLITMKLYLESSLNKQSIKTEGLTK